MSHGKFSRIAGFGKLNQYTQKELITLLIGFDIQVKNISKDEEVLLFRGENVSYEILYDLEGNFKQILREVWLDLHQVFDYRMK